MLGRNWGVEVSSVAWLGQLNVGVGYLSVIRFNFHVWNYVVYYAIYNWIARWERLTLVSVNM